MSKSKYLYNGASITENLEVQEGAWERGDQTLEAKQFFQKQETFALRVDRVIQEQEELFKQKKRERDEIVKRVTIPYLDPDVPDVPEVPYCP